MIKLKVIENKLNVRNTADIPADEKNYAGNLLKDTVVFAEKTIKGVLYRNNDTWYKDQYNRYFWSGGVSEVIDLDAKKDLAINFPLSTDWKNNFLGLPDDLKNSNAAGINIAILDSGVVKQHPNLLNSNITLLDFTNVTNSGEDDIGHGTAVAGIIASKFFEGRGQSGVSNEAQIFSLKIRSAKDTVTDDDEKRMVAALDHLLQLSAPVHIVNLSLSCPDSSQITDRLDQLAKKGTIIIASAFNQKGWDNLFYPANLPFCISVASMNEVNMENAGIENLKKADVIGPYQLVDFCSLEEDKFFQQRIGCSFTTGFVTACTALILSKLFADGKDPKTINKDIVFPLLKKCASPVETQNLFDPNYFGFITKK